MTIAHLARFPLQSGTGILALASPGLLLNGLSLQRLLAQYGSDAAMGNVMRE